MNDKELANTSNQKAFDALAEAARMYERYLELTQIANITFLQQEGFYASAESQERPLGLIVWPSEQSDALLE